MSFPKLCALAVLSGTLLGACAAGTVDGNMFDPYDVREPTVEPPSQAEIDRSFRESLKDIQNEMAEESDDASDGFKNGLLDEWRAPSGTPEEAHPDVTGATTCVDVTSYDYDWNNDMFCTRPDGSTFYTSYEGASRFE